MDQNLKLSKESLKVISLKSSKSSRLIGRLIYLINTFFDLAFCFQALSQFIDHPRRSHLHSVIWVLRYIKGIVGHGLFFPSTSSLHIRFLWLRPGKLPWFTLLHHQLLYFLGNSFISWKFGWSWKPIHGVYFLWHHFLGFLAMWYVCKSSSISPIIFW